MSKSNTKYIATVAFAQGFALIMKNYYGKKKGRQNFKNMTEDLYKTADEIIINHPESINKKEVKRVEAAVAILNHYGLEHAKSYQTYLSFLIALISERLEELSRSKRKSPKVAKLETLLEKVVPMYEYYEIRTRNEDFNRDALKLLNNFNLLF